jgi:hypothetical protein
MENNDIKIWLSRTEHFEQSMIALNRKLEQDKGIGKNMMEASADNLANMEKAITSVQLERDRLWNEQVEVMTAIGQVSRACRRILLIEYYLDDKFKEELICNKTCSKRSIERCLHDAEQELKAYLKANDIDFCN